MWKEFKSYRDYQICFDLNEVVLYREVTSVENYNEKALFVSLKNGDMTEILISYEEFKNLIKGVNNV